MGNYARVMSPTCLVEQEIWARQSAPPLYDDAMRTSHPYDEYMATLRSQLQSRSPDAQQAPPPAPSDGGATSRALETSIETADTLVESEDGVPNSDNLIACGATAAPAADVASVDGDVELLSCDESVYWRRHSRSSPSTSSQPCDEASADVTVSAAGSNSDTRRGKWNNDGVKVVDKSEANDALGSFCDIEAFDVNSDAVFGDSNAVIPALKTRLRPHVGSAGIEPITQL